MTQIAESPSVLLNNQFPEFIVDNNPNFVAFVRAYYEWMSQQPTSNTEISSVAYHSKNILDYSNIDTTPENFINYYSEESLDSFIDYFRNDFLPYFPNDIALDERKLIKAAREFYSKKGSEESIKFLFRVLYDKDIQISYPKENILKASDGKWQVPQSVKVVLSPANLNFDVSLLNSRQAIGSESNAICKVEKAIKTIDNGINREIVEIFITDLTKVFAAGEQLVVSGTYANNTPFTFSEKIIGSISRITINPKNQGLRYNGAIIDAATGKYTYKGDPVTIYGGLDSTPEAQKAVAYVNNVTTGQISTIAVVKGGFGYAQHPNSTVTVVSDSGTGANVIIQTITGTSNVVINTDSIDYKKGVVLSAANYQFANTVSSDINTTLGHAFSYSNVVVGSIGSMDVINGGAGFRTVPSYDIRTYFETDLSSDYLQPPVTALDLTNHKNTIQFIQDLGVIANVTVLRGGTGYNPGSDTIVVNSAWGGGASFTFTANGTGSITSVTVVNGGQGYQHPIMDLNLSVVSGTGSGAQLIAYGYSEGAQLSTTVTDIGRIIDFRLESRGFDYITKPNVSLRLLDVQVSDAISSGQALTIDEGSLVYQGIDENNKSFSAYIDKVNSTLSDTKPSFFRLYNYSGSIDDTIPLILVSETYPTGYGYTINTAPVNSIIVYGNGMAKANAEFLNGLVNYNGFYLNTDGQLSADQYLQDQHKYHNFSYVIQVEKSINDFRNTLNRIAHPVGTQLLGEFVLIDNKSIVQTLKSNLSIIPSITGLVTANAFWANANVEGSGTAFTSNANVGDMIIINSNDEDRMQIKQIIDVPTDTMITLESNTRFLGNGSLSTTTACTTVIVTANIANKVLVNDYIRYSIDTGTGLVNYQAEITGITNYSDNAHIVLDSAPGQTANNVVYYVYPTMTGVPYSIINNLQ